MTDRSLIFHAAKEKVHKPVTERSELFVLLEKIFAPLQAALLALAIRRKFMR
jgi:hypothetical protein